MSFSSALQAHATVRVADHHGLPERRVLDPRAFHLYVNGTERPVQLIAQPRQEDTLTPLVMLVFPPNQRFLHTLAVADAKKYFGALPGDALPWRVAILDADGSSTAFTSVRQQLLEFLETVGKRNEPVILGPGAGMGTWGPKAVAAISTMGSSQATKVLLVFAPRPKPVNDFTVAEAYAGPESLIPAALRIGAQIYTARVGGPESLNWERSSVLTAMYTGGGVESSLPDTAAAIQRDLASKYTLGFAMTPRDRDLGIPRVQVRVEGVGEQAFLIDVQPVAAADQAARRSMNKAQLDALWKATEKPVTNEGIGLFQRVDYFPLRGGFQATLPMSAEMHWMRPGLPPADLSVAEFVQDLQLNEPVLEREMEPAWQQAAVFWERDGHLRPGPYLWRVVLHDSAGEVWASAQQRVLVGLPPSAEMAVSSLIVGKQCEAGRGKTGLTRRQDQSAEDAGTAQFQTDPMQAEGCRLHSDPTGDFPLGEPMRAFVRIYPARKLEKMPPERWTATFVLRSAEGTVEVSQPSGFQVDGQSGYVAFVELPLSSDAVKPGKAAVEVNVTGPGFLKQPVASRAVRFVSSRTGTEGSPDR